MIFIPDRLFMIPRLRGTQTQGIIFSLPGGVLSILARVQSHCLVPFATLHHFSPWRGLVSNLGSVPNPSSTITLEMPRPVENTGDKIGISDKRGLITDGGFGLQTAASAAASPLDFVVWVAGRLVASLAASYASSASFLAFFAALSLSLAAALASSLSFRRRAASSLHHAASWCSARGAGLRRAGDGLLWVDCWEMGGEPG